MTIPRLNSFRNQSPGLRALAFGLVVLGVCVFAWGLRYKLSLYDPPRAGSHHMAEAKLLPPGKERDRIQRAGDAQTPDAAVTRALCTLALALFAFTVARVWPGLGGWMQRPSPLRRVPGYNRLTPLFVRPPPRTR